MTIGGMCVFLGIAESTWHAWRKSRPDLSEVITRAEQIIRQQKFEGAAAELLNANIIAREIGLADKTESKVGAANDALAELIRLVSVQSARIGS